MDHAGRETTHRMDNRYTGIPSKVYALFVPWSVGYPPEQLQRVGLIHWEAMGADDGSSVKTIAAKRRLAVLEPTGELFVNGLACGYDDEFPTSADDPNAPLAEVMTPEEFDQAIGKINDALLDHWPCMPCTSFAYGCCICTLGLSFYCATSQVQEAEQRVNMQIRRVNEQSNFKAKRIEWRLVRVWYKRKSYIEISVADDENGNSSISTAAAPAALATDSAAAPETLSMTERLV